MAGLGTPAISRREARRRDRREAIIQVARCSFLEKGYAATTMSEIAAKLGGSKGTLWSYFPCKDDLFAAVMRHATEDYHAGLTQMLDAPGELVPTLHRFATDLLRRVTSPDTIRLRRLVITEAERFPQMSAIFFEIAPKHTRALLADYLAGAMARGQLRRADPGLAARTLITLTLSGCDQQVLWGLMTEHTEEHIKADVDFAVDCFLRIYAPEHHS